MRESKTILLFGEVDDQGVPQSVLAHFGTDAYEHYMVVPYVKELMMVRNSDYICWSPNFSHLYAAIQMFETAPVQFEELGSTLFSTIDKIDKLNDVFSSTLEPVNSVNYVGIEVSGLLIDLAEALHQSSRLTHYSAWEEVPRVTNNIISRSYQSTSYAFDHTEELFAWMKNAKFGIHGVWWSLDGKEKRILAAGNRITLFDPDIFCELARAGGFELTVLKSQVFSYCDVRFSASWVMLSNLSVAEASKMANILKVINADPVIPACDLRKSSLKEQPYVGSHAGFIPVQTDVAFNFYSDQLLFQWNRYIQGR